MSGVGSLPATSKQTEYIDGMRKDRRWDPDTMDQVSVDVTGRKVADLARRDASALIEHLRRTAKQRETQP